MVILFFQLINGISRINYLISIILSEVPVFSNETFNPFWFVCTNNILMFASTCDPKWSWCKAEPSEQSRDLLLSICRSVGYTSMIITWSLTLHYTRIHMRTPFIIYKWDAYVGLSKRNNSGKKIDYVKRWKKIYLTIIKYLFSRK